MDPVRDKEPIFAVDVRRAMAACGVLPPEELFDLTREVSAGKRHIGEGSSHSRLRLF
jgi:hypothetical protein